MNKPRLSVGLPVFNGEKYLRQSLDLLLSQDFDDFELIISDNGSTDQTSDICVEYARRDARVRYFRSASNQGATWNFRRVFELAQGEYFKWATYDDECCPTMFRQCMAVMEKAEATTALVYPRFELIDDEGSVIDAGMDTSLDHVFTTARTPHQRLGHVLKRLRHGMAFYGIIRASLLRQTRPFGHIAADWVKVAELAMLGQILEVPEVLFRYRIHSGSSVNATSSWRKLLAWHDPSLQGKTPWLPKSCAFVLEYLRSIRHLPLSTPDRLRCYAVACLAPPWRWFSDQTLDRTRPLRIWMRRKTGWTWLSKRSRAD